MLVELTGLPIANCSMYDAATALGEAATLADRVRSTSGDAVLVPEHLREGKRAVLENYCAGADLTVESYPMADGNADVDALADRAGDDVVMVYAENPTVRGCIEERLATIGGLAADADALFTLGSDPVSLSVLQEPASVGADVVVGEAGALGLPTAYGMGLGIFACSDEFLRQVPGRLVGAGEDAAGDRAFTLTLQTREQHIRKERATSNICTNQGVVALRAAIHAATLAPTGSSTSRTTAWGGGRARRPDRRSQRRGRTGPRPPPRPGVRRARRPARGSYRGRLRDRGVRGPRDRRTPAAGVCHRPERGSNRRSRRRFRGGDLSDPRSG